MKSGVLTTVSPPQGEAPAEPHPPHGRSCFLLTSNSRRRLRATAILHSLSGDWPSFLFVTHLLQGINDVLDRLWGDVIEVVPRMATGGGFEVARVQDTRGRQFHGESRCAVEPCGIGWVTTETLVARPVEWMQVQHDCGLTG